MMTESPLYTFATYFEDNGAPFKALIKQLHLDMLDEHSGPPHVEQMY